MDNINQNLTKLNIVLPNIIPPVANYSPILQSGNYLYISGQLPFKSGKLAYSGHLGNNISIKEGMDAAQLCAINVLAALKSKIEDWNQLKTLLKITVFIATTSDFTQHPQVADGASDLFFAILGDKGKHSRSAVGVNSLPFNAPVEIEAIFELNN